MKKFTLVLLAFLIIFSLLVLVAEPALLASLYWVPWVDYALLLIALFITKRYQYMLRFSFLILIIALPLADIVNMYEHAHVVDTLYLHFMIGNQKILSYILFMVILPAIMWIMAELHKPRRMGYNHVRG
jgi:hypothetical protein